MEPFRTTFDFGPLKLPIPFTDSEDELNDPKSNEQNNNKQTETPPPKKQSPIKLISNIVVTPKSNKQPLETDNENSPSKSIIVTRSSGIKTAQSDTPIKSNKEKLLPRDFSKTDSSVVASTSKNSETSTPTKCFKSKISPKAFCKTSKLTNIFKTIYNEIMATTHLKILLTEKEHSTLDDFAKMDEQYVFYCLSLFLHTKSWTNVLKYRDRLKINMTDFAVTNMCKILEHRGYFLNNYKDTESTRALLQILDLSDVKNICESLKITIPPRERQLKSGIVHILMDFCKQESEDCTQDVGDLDAILRKEIYARLGYCVKLSADLCAALRKLHVLYSFANEDVKDVRELYEFLEKVERAELMLPEHYVHQMEPFHSSTEFTDFVKVLELKQLLDRQIQNKLSYHKQRCLRTCNKLYTIFQNVLSKSVCQPPYLQHFSEGAQCAFALMKGAVYLRAHFPNEARQWLELLVMQDKYLQEYRGMCLEHLVAVTVPWDLAVKRVIRGLNDDNLSKLCKMKLTLRAQQLRTNKQVNNRLLYDELVLRSLNVPDFKDFPQSSISLNGPIQNVKLLDNALAQYINEEDFTDGVVLKEKFLQSLLGIFFWDAIYKTEVKGAFISEIQTVPLDLKYNFYENRKLEIERRLNEIEKYTEEDVEKCVRNIFDNHAHETSLVDCETFDESHVLKILSLIGRKALAEILRTIVMNYRELRKGFPNLFVWSETSKQYKFICILRATEKFSVESRLWLDMLKNMKVPVEVCRIIGKKKKKCDRSDDEMESEKEKSSPKKRKAVK